jgi:predicted enzyme related to lactoylglutathione lyase
MTPREVFQVEIRSRDLDRAIDFYGRLFDWRVQRTADDYALIDAGMVPILSIMETRDPGYPTGICNLVHVDDCEREARRAAELGGRICVHKWQVPGSGWFTGTLDPWGNELFFWQPDVPPRPRLRGSRKNPVVAIDIPTPDLAAAARYYGALVGWSFDGVTFRDDQALMEGGGVMRGISLVGGTFARRLGRTTDYIAVDDLEATGRQIAAAGGRVVVERIDVPGDCRLLVFDDPEGNRMGALQTLGAG